MLVCRRSQIEPCVLPYTKLMSEWINDLNIKPSDKLKGIEDKFENALESIDTGDKFLKRTSLAPEL